MTGRSPSRRPHPARGSRAGSSTSRAGPSPAPGSRSRTSGRPRTATSAGGSRAGVAPGMSRMARPGPERGVRAPGRASAVAGEPRSRRHRPRRPLPPGRHRPDRIAEIFVSGPTIATAQLYAMSRDGADVRATTHQRADCPARSSSTPAGSSTPPRPASRSRASSATRTRGRPIAGIDPPRHGLREHSLVPAPGIEATTDAQGHYRLTGLPRAPAYRLFVEPGEGQPYPKATFRAAGGSPAFEPVTFRHRAQAGHPGPRPGDRQGDRPAGLGLSSMPTPSRIILTSASSPATRSSYPPYALIKDDGRYEVVALPGRGIIGCRAAEMERATGGTSAPRRSRDMTPRRHGLPDGAALLRRRQLPRPGRGQPRPQGRVGDAGPPGRPRPHARGESRRPRRPARSPGRRRRASATCSRRPNTSSHRPRSRSTPSTRRSPGA